MDFTTNAPVKKNKPDHISKRIAKNTAWLFSGQIIGRLLRAAIVIYAARILGAASWGAFSYALSVAAFLTIFSDIGINALLTREGSKNPNERERYLATSFFVKLTLLLVMSAGVLIFVNHLTNLPEAVSLMPITLAVFIFDSLRDLGGAMARALEEMRIEAVTNIFTNIAITIFGIIALYFSPTSMSMMLAYALGTLTGFVFIVIPLRRYFSNLTHNFDRSLVKPILATAWPFGLVGLMGAVMINTDVLILGWMRSATEVGLYSAAQRPIQLLYIAPSLIATAFFPQLARLAVKSKEKFSKLFEQALAVIYLLALPLTLGGIILAKQFVILLYGASYAPAYISFAILSATLAVVFPATLIGNAIFAHNKQKTFLIYVALGIFGNIILDLLLIPRWGMNGSAVATLINQLIINIYAWWLMQKTAPFSISKHLIKLSASAFGMGIVTFALQYAGVPVLINIAASVVVYLMLLAAIKEPTFAAIRSVLKREPIWEEPSEL
jgi:O-antigen/teichoic acid export membrane protein